MAKRVPAVSYMVFLICGMLLYGNKFSPLRGHLSSHSVCEAVMPKDIRSCLSVSNLSAFSYFQISLKCQPVFQDNACNNLTFTL